MKPPTPRSLLILALALLLSGATLCAADAPRPAVTLAHTERIELNSARTGKNYVLLVSLPEDYATSGKSYPVLYVLDGWHFPLLAFLQNNNLYSERMRPVIMVNIGHEPGKNPMPLRAHDFTPTSMQDPAVDRSGGAPAFLEFIAQDVIPLVERTYRTDPTDRGLLGHSLGGLFALYTLVERPGLFQRIVAASPAIDWDHNVLFPRARAALKNLTTPVRLDLSAGDEPDVYGHDITGGTTAFAALLDELKPANLEHRYTHFPGENHNSIRPVSFPHGLYWVYRASDAATDKPASSEQDAIRAARLAQNAAIVRHDLDAIASHWTDNVTICRGLGLQVAGKADYLKLFRSDDPATGTVYERIPDDISVSADWPLAFETGHWVGRAKGAAIITGKYSAQWVKRDGHWLIRGEVFVALDGQGDGKQLPSAP